jgi:hypothetical protein
MMRTWQEAYEQLGREYFTELIAWCQANVCEMAKVAGTRRQNIYRFLHRFGLELPAHRPANVPGHRWSLGRLRIKAKPKPRGAL